MGAKQSDYLFAEHVLRRRFATEEQVQECMELLERLAGEMELQETLANLLVKRGYLAPAQVRVIEEVIHPRRKKANAIEGYRLLARLGTGAMGSVYKAQHLQLDVPVALKVLRLSLASSKTQIERLKREAQLAVRLNHPNIVRGLDVGESNGLYYYVMEFVDGTTVRDLVRRRPLDEKEALRIVRDVARALDHAHSAGVVHRDVKPANIMITRDGVVKLADFGLARGQEPSDLTLEAASIGTPQYLAPEQARRAADATPRSDLFSLGATLYHMVTGKPPFSGGNLGEIFQNVLRCRFDPPESVNPKLGLDTVYVIHRLMRGSPRERYPTAAALLEDLERIARGERVAPADFKGDYQEFLDRQRRKRIAVGSLAALILVAATAFIVVRVITARAERERREACRVANATGAERVAQVRGLAALRALVEDMRRAHATHDCRPDEIRDLESRLASAGSDLASLMRGEEILTEARDEEAHYRNLAAELGRRRDEAALPGVAERFREIQETVERLSREEARTLWRRVYTPAHESAERALQELKAFAQEIPRFVLVDKPWFTNVGRHVRLLEALLQKWRALEQRYGPEYREALEGEKPEYGNARDQLEALVEERTRAVAAAAEAGLPRVFTGLFQARDPRDTSLRTLEYEEWKSVDRKARTHESKGELEEAVRVLRDFFLRAREKKLVARSRLDEVEHRLQNRLIAQRDRLEDLKGYWQDDVGRRRYVEAAAELRRQLADELWLRDAAIHARSLAERAEAVEQVWQHLLTRLSHLPPFEIGEDDERPTRVRCRRAKSPGESSVLLCVDDDGGSHEVPLSDVPHDALAAALDLPPGKLRGAFYAAESFGAVDPRMRLDYLQTAVGDLEELGDPWRRELELVRIRTKNEIEAREKRAAERFTQLNEAESRRDFETALLNAKLLLSRDGLLYTDFVERNLGELQRRRADLERLANATLMRVQAAVPKRNFVYVYDKAKDNARVRITFDFRPWYPDEDRVPDGVVREQWLEQTARVYWRERYRKWPEDPEKKPPFERYYERAKHQLLLFNDEVVAVEGGARLAGGPWDNGKAWEKRKEPPHVVRLRNLLPVDEDWAIEAVLQWPDKPSFFGITCGGVQAALVFSTKLNGGGQGVRVFLQDDLLEDLEAKHLAPFHRRVLLRMLRFRDLESAEGIVDLEPRLREARKRPPRHGGWLRGFEPGKAHRVRLERDGGRVRFYLATEEAWERAEGAWTDAFLQAAMKASRAKLRKAAVLEDGSTDFRMWSPIRFRLHEVVVEGETEIHAGS